MTSTLEKCIKWSVSLKYKPFLITEHLEKSAQPIDWQHHTMTKSATGPDSSRHMTVLPLTIPLATCRVNFFALFLSL